MPRSDLDLPSSERPYELLGADLMPDQPSVVTRDEPAELRRRLGTTMNENRDLSTRVRELEAELDRRSVELAKLRRTLRGAVHAALTDPLTGLANRRSFDLELGALNARVSRSSPAHLVMVDVDHFKRVNDAHGHDLGDELLRVVGEIILTNVRRDGLVARLGGDEFAILLPNTSLDDATVIAIRLCELFASRPLVLRGSSEVIKRITLSIGVAGCHADETMARWYARADAALYEAKRRGRNRTSIAGSPELSFHDAGRCKSAL